MTPIELRQKGYQALLAALGSIETIRFLQQAGWGRRQLHRRTPSVAYPSYTGGISSRIFTEFVPEKPTRRILTDCNSKSRNNVLEIAIGQSLARHNQAIRTLNHSRIRLKLLLALRNCLLI